MLRYVRLFRLHNFPCVAVHKHYHKIVLLLVCMERNLKFQVIKQSHIILNFLAMEGRITCEHMDVIWAAAQLKHCAKPVYDLLPGLVKHLAASPTLHLYNLLTKLEPKEHTEQTLYLASALIKAVWSRGGVAPEVGLISVAAQNVGMALHKCPVTSSENSVSLDQR